MIYPILIIINIFSAKKLQYFYCSITITLNHSLVWFFYFQQLSQFPKATPGHRGKRYFKSSFQIYILLTLKKSFNVKRFDFSQQYAALITHFRDLKHLNTQRFQIRRLQTRNQLRWYLELQKGSAVVPRTTGLETLLFIVKDLQDKKIRRPIEKRAIRTYWHIGKQHKKLRIIRFFQKMLLCKC